MIDFEKIKEVSIPKLNGGEGETKSKMFADESIKIMISTLDVGCTIGLHEHATSSEIMYVLLGEAKCILDNSVEYVKLGECHYCKKGSRHSIANYGKVPLVMFDIVPELAKE